MKWQPKGHRSRRVLCVGLVGAAAFSMALAGCGTSGHSASNGSGFGLAQSRTLTIATTGDSAPYTIREGGKLTGLDVDICSAIAKGLGLKPKFEVVDFNSIIPGIVAGRYDLGCSGAQITKARIDATNFYMSNPTSATGVAALVKSDSRFQNASDLKDAKLGAATGSAQLALWEKNIGNTVTPTYFPGIAAAISGLKSGRIDGYIGPTLNAEYYIKQQGGMRAVQLPGSETQAGMLVRRNKAFLSAVNEQIAKLKKDGDLKTLLTKWAGNDVTPPADQLPTF